MIAQVPGKFKPKINTVYPPNNFTEFERWFGETYIGCNTDRIYLPVYWCGYQVNHNYGKDEVAMFMLQEFIDELPTDKKYFTISQYDDSVGVDFKGKDVLIFDMSVKGENRYPLPLIGQAHPFTFNEPKKYLANFIGNITHPIREHAQTLQGKDGYYISFQKHSIDDYCRVIAQSHFTLCYRGYGLNSFRIAEALQFGSIPVYISDEFIEAHNWLFSYYGVIIKEENISEINSLYSDYATALIPLVDNGKQIYRDGFTYEGCFNQIIKHLENEQQKSKGDTQVSHY